jgi:hypothetical protein
LTEQVYLVPRRMTPVPASGRSARQMPEVHCRGTCIFRWTGLRLAPSSLPNQVLSGI